MGRVTDRPCVGACREGQFEQVVFVPRVVLGCTRPKRKEVRQVEAEANTCGGAPWGVRSGDPWADSPPLPQLDYPRCVGLSQWKVQSHVEHPRVCSYTWDPPVGKWVTCFGYRLEPPMSQLLPSTHSSRPALIVFERPAAAGVLSQNGQRTHGPEEHACKPREQTQ